MMKGLLKLIAFSTILFTQPLSAQVSWRQIEKDVRLLAADDMEGREIGTKGELMAATYIANRFQEFGLLPFNQKSYFQPFTKLSYAHPHDTIGITLMGRNVIGMIDHRASKTIVIGAHFDHLGWGKESSLYVGEAAIHNGADDNASGVAGLLYLAKKLKQVQLNHNVIFIAFSGEEKGLLGSNYFVHDSIFHQESISFMMNMDMIGRLDSNRRISIGGVGTAKEFIPAIQKSNSFGFDIKYDSSGIGPSDHTSFYLKNIPVLHFFTGQHADYHKPTDDAEWINYQGINEIGDLIFKIIVQLDELQQISFQKTKEEQKSSVKGFKVTLGIMPDYLFSGNGVRIDGVKDNRPAAIAGLQAGDIIMAIDQMMIANLQDYMRALQSYDSGDKVTIKVKRAEKTLQFKVRF